MENTVIKVGDEVIVNKRVGVAVREPYCIGSDKELFILVWFGYSMSSTSIKNVTKTGKHYSYVPKLLKQIGDFRE